MKKLLTFLIVICLIGITYKYKEEITEYILLKFVYKNEFNYSNTNEYKKNTKSFYLNETNDFKPKNKRDILNIIYTAINNGYDEFNFFCSFEYKTCIDDVKEITKNTDYLSVINDFVSPYNSYDKLDIAISSLGKIKITVNKNYSNQLIAILNSKIENIINEIIDDNMNEYEKIKVIHDYIINNTIYDKEKINNLNVPSQYNSSIAYGPLVEGYAICSGYADAMALFLDKLGIPNHKISNSNHVWNLVFLDGKYLHLDLTWDDPVTDTGINILTHDYFLITTDKLLEYDQTEHNFNENIFIEAKQES